MQIALAKSRSKSGASHQPASMGSCLTISDRCLPCLPSTWVSPCVPGITDGSEGATLVQTKDDLRVGKLPLKNSMRRMVNDGQLS